MRSRSTHTEVSTDSIALNPYQVTYCIETNAKKVTPSWTGQKMNEQASQQKNDLINSCFLLTSVASCSCRSQFPFLPNWNKGNINMSLRCIKFVLKAWTAYSNNTENWTTFIRKEFNIYAYYSFFDWGQSSLNKIIFSCEHFQEMWKLDRYIAHKTKKLCYFVRTVNYMQYVWIPIRQF